MSSLNDKNGLMSSTALAVPLAAWKGVEGGAP